MEATAPYLFICPDQSTADAVAAAIPAANTAVGTLDGPTATSVAGRTVVAVLDRHIDPKDDPVPDAVRSWAADALERRCAPFVATLPWRCDGLDRTPESWAQLVEADPEMAAFSLTTGRRPALAPDYPDTTHDLHEAERLLEVELSQWALAIARHDQRLRKTAPQAAALVSVGVGKSERALRLIANHPALRGKRIAYYFPSHKLAEELVERYRQIAGLDSPVPIHWKGRTQPGMCQRPGLIEQLTRAGLSVKSNACVRISKDRPPTFCPFYDQCAFIRLEAEANHLRDDPRGAVAFLPHSFLSMAANAGPFRPRKGDTRPPIEVAIIDESFWSSMIPGRPGALLLDTLSELRRVPAKRRKVEAQDVPEDGELPEPDLIDSEATAKLAEASQAIRDLTIAGKLTLTALTEAGFRRDSLRKLRDDERKIDVLLQLDPAAPDEAGMAAIRARAIESRKCKARARLWSVLAAEIEQADRREVPEGAKGAPLNCVRVEKDTKGRHVLLMHWAHEIKAFDPWQTPTLMLDATADARVLRTFFPELMSRDMVTIRARDLKVEVTQVTDTGLGKTSIIDHLSAALDERKRRDGRRRNIATLARCLARIHGEEAVVVNLELERQLLAELGRQIDPAMADLAGRIAGHGDAPAADAVQAIGCSVPVDMEGKSAKAAAGDMLRTIVKGGGVDLGHFNALRGRDHWKTVPAMIVAGRPQASPEGVDHLARAIFGPGRALIRREDAEVERRIGVLRVRDGSVQVVRFTDCRGELQRAVMRQIREAELVQAIGRARLARREGRARCVVYLLTNVPVDTTIDRAARLHDLAPDRLAQSVLETGLLLRSPAELARVLPHLWASAATARQDVLRRAKPENRARTQHSDGLIRDMLGENPIRVRYCLDGQGKKPAGAVMPRTKGTEAAPREALEAIVGNVCWFEIEGAAGVDSSQQEAA